MTLEAITFWALGAVLLASALAVVLTKNLFHSVLWLALSLTATAGIFLALDAEFLAAVQLLLYAGGVVTIVVFAIVTTERLIGDRMSQVSRHLVTGAILSGALLFLGAWDGPGAAGSSSLAALYFLLKAMFVFLLVTWIRWSFVRIRVDQILAISWKLLLPIALLLLMATAVVVAWKGPVGG